MNLFPTLLIIAVVGLGAILWLLREMRGQISASEVRRLLQGGAKVIDVRSPEEFAARRLEQTFNIPYGDIVRHIHTISPDPTAPLLVHCLSGGRSAIAQRLLRRHGYTRVYNLGSLRRAQKLTGLPLLTKSRTTEDTDSIHSLDEPACRPAVGRESLPSVPNASAIGAPASGNAPR